MAQKVLQSFTCCFAQSEQDAERFKRLGAPSVKVIGNLKFAAQAPPVNALVTQELQTIIKKRPVWLAASTHEGEEELIAKAHCQIQKAYPNALCIIVPRHPERGTKITEIITSHNLKVAQRSAQILPQSDVDIYLADTLGEIGTFYALCPIAFVAGSLVPIGGHNLIEAAQLECAILHGSYMDNFSTVQSKFANAGAVIAVDSWQALAEQVGNLFANPKLQQQLASNAQQVVANNKNTVAQILAAIDQIISAESSHAQSA